MLGNELKQDTECLDSAPVDPESAIHGAGYAHSFPDPGPCRPGASALPGPLFFLGNLAVSGFAALSRGRLLSQSHGQVEHLVQRDPKLFSKALHGLQRRIPPVALDPADIGPVQPSFQSQSFLAQSHLLTQLAKGRADEGGDIHLDKVAGRGLLIYGL